MMKNLYKDWTAESYEREIASLKEQNDKCHELRLKFIDAQVTVAGKAEKEIEALRSELDTEKGRTDIDLVNDPKAWKMLCDEKERGDEWKRRARCLWDLMYDRSEFLQIHAEAAEWFEEE